MRVVVDGYAWIDLSEIDDIQRRWIRDRNTFVQKVSPEYRDRQETPTVVSCFVDDDANHRLGIPREFFFGHKTKDHEITYNVTNGDPWPDRFVPSEPMPWEESRDQDPSVLTFFDTDPDHMCPVKLKPEQEQAASVARKHLLGRPAAGGIVQAPVGWGKTVFSLSLIRDFKVKTAILVHREFLMDQWRKMIQRFLPDTKVGHIYGDRWVVDDCHIVLVMTETIASWVKRGQVPDAIRGMFGFIITDETHRAAAPTWAPVVPVFRAAKRLGVSANPRRSDGLEKVFLGHIGPKIFTGQEEALVPKVRRVWTRFQINSQKLNTQLISKEIMLRFMVKNVGYNRDVVEQIISARKAGRRIIVFSGRIDHLKLLRAETEARWDGPKLVCDFFIGGMLAEERAIAALADVIFATYSMAAEGLDIPPLDTAVLATPIRNPQQVVGRILRPHSSKKDPVVVDMRADDIPVCRDYAESRDRHYERLYRLPPPQKAQAS